MKHHKRSNIGYIEYYFGSPSTIKRGSSTTSKAQLLHLLTDFNQISYMDKTSGKNNISYIEIYFGPQFTTKRASSTVFNAKLLYLLGSRPISIKFYTEMRHEKKATLAT